MEDKKYSFQKLTPVSNANTSVYEEAIDFAFNNLDVKNVAISGAYCAGKSSILESYKSKHKEYLFIHISLAHFRTPEQEKSESEETVKESLLEGKILNQLIHQIPADRIPQTNFRIKKDFSPKKLAWLTAFACLFIGSIIFLYSSPRVASFVASLPDDLVRSVLSIIFSPCASVIATLICIVCSAVFIFFLIRAQKNKNILRKISLQGNEIEIFEEQDDSYFDKYLNEVIYLFERVEANVIVFEDMDRFNASRIFERLREVNTLVNIQRKKKLNGDYIPLRFFYLLRDDIFISKDRTKFFDFIIPIVPVVDSSNSYEQFLKHLKEGNLLDKFDQAFLQSLSLYVDDMRILKNIYNEFVVYIHRLNITDLDWNKMMAIIAYKNLFPRDFSDLQLDRGFIYEMFEQKPRIIEAALSSAKEQRQELNERIELAKNETLISQQEIDDVYAAKKQRLPTQFGAHTRDSQIQSTKYDEEIAIRKQAIQDKLPENLSRLESELSDTDHDITLTQTKSLKELITRDNSDTIFAISHVNEIGELRAFEEIKSSDYFALLKFLIRSGYVDETYNDYMTYFYEDSMSANDKTFLRRITDKRGAEYTYALREPLKVIESPILRAVEFEQEETLNFDLLEYLFLNNAIPKYATYLVTLIAQIRETRNFDFVSKYYATGKAREQFVIKTNEQWSDFFSQVLRGKAMPSAQIWQYSMDTLYFSDKETINSVNADNCLTEYISQCSDYLAIEQPDIDKLVSGFLLIDVSFATIDYDKSNKPLFDEVYRRCLYALTFENISLMLRKEYGIESNSDIVHKNYTQVKSQTDSPLARYVSENMSAYAEILLTNCDGNISDDENVAISLLNNDDVGIAAKNRYIELLTTVISEVTQVSEPSLWAVMMSRGIIAFSVTNVVNYFIEHGIDGALSQYINDEQDEADFTPVADDFGEEAAGRLFNAVAICNSIATNKYKKILVDLNYYFDDFDTDKIADEKFIVLISEGIIQMDVDSLEFVRKKYARHLYVFIQRNFADYLALQTAEIFRLDEALQIIIWDIEDDQKIRLLSFTNEQISVVGMFHSDEVNAYIITHNFKATDKQHLYTRYSSYGEKTRAAIAELATEGVREIITNNMSMDDNLLSILLQADAVTRDQKIMLFTMAIPILNEDTCMTHFDELELSDLNGVFAKGGGRRNYEKSRDVTTILDALKLNGWIHEYRVDERNNDKYTVIKNRPRGKE